MPGPTQLAKAKLSELNSDYEKELNEDARVTVQFNPETLKVSFANQIKTPSGDGTNKETQSRQLIGAGTTKLSLQLWFDVNAPLPESEAPVDDVRRLTEKVAYFITPREHEGKTIQPAVRFLWGSFQFDGLMDSLEESLEYFSNEGKPLRASMSLSMSQQKITKFAFRNTGTILQNVSNVLAGARQLTQAVSGSSLQKMASARGMGNEWRDIAEANGIENPRMLQPGAIIDMQAHRLRRT